MPANVFQVISTLLSVIIFSSAGIDLSLSDNKNAHRQITFQFLIFVLFLIVISCNLAFSETLHSQSFTNDLLKYPFDIEDRDVDSSYSIR